jgi:urate oxidase
VELLAAGLTPQRQQYGKSGVRVAQVRRAGTRHDFTDIEVDITLTGDMTRAYTEGDNASVLPTDSQKNTVYAFAKRYGIHPLEDFGLLLAEHFVSTQGAVRAARVTIRARLWQRLTPRHSFMDPGEERRTVTVTHDGESSWVIAGLCGLAVLNTTGSEFRGYLKDPYTTLPEAEDRILSTVVDARWRYAVATPSDDWDGCHARIRSALLDAFATTYSRSLQQTLHAMASAALTACTSAAEIRLALPNRHYVAVDLAQFGLENQNDVFIATGAPYGLIEGSLLRPDAPPAGLAWW